MKAKEYSLREKKHARTKIAIMNAFMERMRHGRSGDISVKKVCADAEVAEGTFFNYFPEKIDVIGYYLHLMAIRMIWQARREVAEGKYLPMIDSVFKQSAEEWGEDELTYQIISALLVQGSRPKIIEISGLEKKLAFPDCPGIEETPAVFMDDWFRDCLTQAQKCGELPIKINVDDVVISLITILSGTLLATRFKDSDKRGYHYMRQLQLLWRGLGAKG